MFPSSLQHITEKMDGPYILSLVCEFHLGNYEIRRLLGFFLVFPAASFLVGCFLLNIHLDITSISGAQIISFLYFPISLFHFHSFSDCTTFVVSN